MFTITEKLLLDEIGQRNHSARSVADKGDSSGHFFSPHIDGFIVVFCGLHIQHVFSLHPLALKAIQPTILFSECQLYVLTAVMWSVCELFSDGGLDRYVTVSYTHLTLPTIYSV